MIRCYNCGRIGHKTQVCPSYGPWYLEPGKTSEDYAEEVRRIANLFAADIIREHEGGHSGGSEEEKEHGNNQRTAAERRTRRAVRPAGEQGRGQADAPQPRQEARMD